MKLKLDVEEKRYAELAAFLTARGIEIDDEADLVLREVNRFAGHLIVRDTAREKRVFLSVSEIISIESFGHTVTVYSEQGSYQASERLYQIAGRLDPEQFLRISNSVIIATNRVRRIAPTLSMKFILTLSDGRNVDVTRSYYYIFKEAFGI